MVEEGWDDTILRSPCMLQHVTGWSAVYGIGVLSVTCMTPHVMEWTSQECAADCLRQHSRNSVFWCFPE